MDFGLRGRCALVCASTAGLGRATAEALAAEGARVVISGRRQGLAEEIAAALPGAEAVRCDITDEGAAHRLVNDAREALGAEIDMVVLNGPGPTPSGAEDISVDDTRAAIESLMLFPQSVVEQILPTMREQGWGRILSIGSYGVLEPLEDLVLSNIGRSALAAYLKTLAGEVASEGVTVNMLLPGRIDTERVRGLDSGRAARDNRTAEAVAAEYAATIPAARYGTAEEFGAVAAFLCSQQAAYITGSAVRCDGGLVHHL